MRDDPQQSRVRRRIHVTGSQARGGRGAVHSPALHLTTCPAQHPHGLPSPLWSPAVGPLWSPAVGLTAWPSPLWSPASPLPLGRQAWSRHPSEGPLAETDLLISRINAGPRSSVRGTVSRPCMAGRQGDVGGIWPGGAPTEGSKGRRGPRPAYCAPARPHGAGCEQGTGPRAYAAACTTKATHSRLRAGVRVAQRSSARRDARSAGPQRARTGRRAASQLSRRPQRAVQVRRDRLAGQRKRSHGPAGSGGWGDATSVTSPAPHGAHPRGAAGYSSRPARTGR
jgi:hypothetical protein